MNTLHAPSVFSVQHFFSERMEEIKDMTTVDRPYPSRWGAAVSALNGQWRALWPVMLLIYPPIVLAFAILIAIRLRTGIAIAEFTRDPLAFTDFPVYKGVVSNLGAVIWSGAAAVCFFSYGVLRTWAAGGPSRRFLLAGGLLTVLLLLDDLFLLHEVVFPQHVGVVENLVYATHALLLLGFVVWFRSTILQTDFPLLALALAGMVCSIGMDIIILYVSVPGVIVFEDGAKLFGIVNWAAYFVLVSARLVAAGGDQRHLGSRHAAPHLLSADEAR